MLVAIHDVKAAADIEHTRSVIDRLCHAGRRARLERPEERRGNAPAARCRLLPPPVEPPDKRRQRRFLHRVA